MGGTTGHTGGRVAGTCAGSVEIQANGPQVMGVVPQRKRVASNRCPTVLTRLLGHDPGVLHPAHSAVPESP